MTNIMALDFTNCVKLFARRSRKNVGFKRIDLTDCTNLESMQRNCSKLEKILAFSCNKLSLTKVKNMDTLEKVQEYLKEL